jgi:hypothetical protein
MLQRPIAQQTSDGLGAGMGKAEKAKAPFDELSDIAVLPKVERPKPKACILCRRHRRKCDSLRPCRSCLMRGCADECKEDAKAFACALCRRYLPRQSGQIVFGSDFVKFLL